MVMIDLGDAAKASVIVADLRGASLVVANDRGGDPTDELEFLDKIEDQLIEAIRSEKEAEKYQTEHRWKGSRH